MWVLDVPLAVWVIVWSFSPFLVAFVFIVLGDRRHNADLHGRRERYYRDLQRQCRLNGDRWDDQS
jgi:hypothetical protein